MRGRTLRLSIAVLEAALAAALAVTLVGCTSQTNGDTKEPEAAKGEPIKIGAVVSLTGSYAGLGEPEKQAIQLEVARINEAGGVNGRPIEVLYEDDGTDEAKAVAAAGKLIDQDGVIAIIGATGTGQTMAIRTEVERAGIPQVSMAGGTVITQDFSPLVFQTPWSNTLVVPLTMAALKDAGISKIAIITDSGGFGKDGRAVLAKEAPKAGITIVADETFNAGDADMTAQLTKIKASEAQALVVWNAGKEAATVVQNAKSLSLGLPIYGSHGNARAEFIDGSGDAGEGVRIVAGKILVPSAYEAGSDEYEVATDFVDRFEEKTGAAPSTFAGHAYDALYLIVGALKRIEDEITPEALRDEIEKTDGFVGIGGTFSFSPTDHNGLSTDDLALYEIRGGEWTVVE